MHLIDEIHLLKDMEKVRIRTVFFSMRSNLFALIRLNFIKSEDVRKEYTFDIKDIKFADEDNVDSPIMRLEADGQQFFAHRNRTIMMNPALMQAIGHKDVNKIQTLR